MQITLTIHKVVHHNLGKDYVNSKGSLNLARSYKLIQCRCRNDCKQIPNSKRKEIFDNFWALGSWDSQSQFLASCVRADQVKTRSATKGKPKTKYIRCKLDGKDVCQNVLVGTLGITHHRVKYLVEKKIGPGNIVEPDKRGLAEASNKTTAAALNSVKTFLNMIPAYETHYSDSKKRYFPPGLTKALLYNEYVRLTPPNVKLGSSIFYRELNTYNISIYVPKTDSCSRCDAFKHKLSVAVGEQAEAIRAERSKHWTEAKLAREALKNSNELVNSRDYILAFSFDMASTQPLPRINTSVVFYKRQLWLLNLGIHDFNINKGLMNIWLESEGKRGVNEITSCLLNYLQDMLSSGNYSEIHTYSDGCGGQNKNKQFAIFMSYVCQKYELTWTHRYLVTGHTYLPNDRDFGKLNLSKRDTLLMYTKEQYKNHIGAKFSCIDMAHKFVDVGSLQDIFSVKPKDTTGERFLISKVHVLQFDHRYPLVGFYKNSHSPSEAFKQFDLKTNRSHTDPFAGVDFPPLYPNGVEIASKKYNDLQALLEFVPPVYQDFYKGLRHVASEQDRELLVPPKERGHLGEGDD